MLKLWLDEMLSPSVAAALREQGEAAADDPATRERDDEEQLAWAADEGRVVVTYDVTTFPVVVAAWMAEGRSQAGVVLIHTHTIAQSDLGGQIRALAALARRYRRGDALRDQVLYLPRPRG